MLRYWKALADSHAAPQMSVSTNRNIAAFFMGAKTSTFP